MKTVVILIGMKGSGKSYIGNLIEKELGIKFLQVEPLFIKSHGSKKIDPDKPITTGYPLVIKEIKKYLTKDNIIVIESLGIGKEFENFLNLLKENYTVLLVKIHTSFNTSFQRVKTRDTTNQILLSDNFIKQVNEASSKQQREFVAIIDNENATDEKIVSVFNKLLKF